MHPPAGARNFRFDAPEIVGIDIDERHCRPFTRKHFGNRFAYAGAGGGYDRNRIRQLSSGWHGFPPVSKLYNTKAHVSLSDTPRCALRYRP